MGRMVAGALVPAALLVAVPAAAFDTLELGAARLTPSLNGRLGLQHGTGINYGYGAIDSPGERERWTLYLAAKPRLDGEVAVTPADAFYGGFSAVAATTTLDGEISGQVARAGDEALDTDHAFVGWRHGVLDLSFGGQEFSIGDGFIIGDGNFNQGGEDGQYWTGAFQAWRNSAVLKVNTEPLRADLFWLRSDGDFRDGRVAGVNVETTTAEHIGTFGLTWIEVLQGGAFNLDGMEVFSLRMADVHLPSLPALRLYGEWVLERGRDEQAGGRPNDAVGWYVEAQYSFERLPWTPRLGYRLARLSGDELASAENEEYRGLFFTIFRRDWDTWYQGEIGGEYHLFNQNQVTQMVKLKSHPLPGWALTLYYYHHDLEEPQYFGRPLASTNWAQEVNVGVEHFRGKHFYGFVGVARSWPDAAAREVFGDDPFTVVETFLSYTF